MSNDLRLLDLGISGSAYKKVTLTHTHYGATNVAPT
jgi:hypothetical protein